LASAEVMQMASDVHLKAVDAFGVYPVAPRPILVHAHAAREIRRARGSML
jgi:hypothetical protein